MSQPRTFYILGAGASYGLAPTTQEMKAAIKREYEQVGIYPGLARPTPLHDRVIGRPNFWSADFTELLLQNIQPGALEFLVQKSLYIPLVHIAAPPQYAVFGVVGSPATLFSFNLDGLAYGFCSRNHVVIEPHGRIDRLWFADTEYERWREAVVA